MKKKVEMWNNIMYIAHMYMVFNVGREYTLGLIYIKKLSAKEMI